MSGQIMNKLDIKTLTADDFLTDKPYAYLLGLSSEPFRQELEVNEMQSHAKEIGVVGFLKMWQAYQKQARIMTAKPIGNATDFSGLAERGYQVLNSGGWMCSDDVIFTRSQFGDVVACTHPILPVERLVNIDSHTVKIRLAFRLGRRWHEILVDRSTIASAQKIVQLADHGIAVTSENAKYLIRYLSDIEALNIETISTRQSVTRLGWVDDGVFSPYAKDVVFDGDAMFGQIYQACQPKGSLNRWLETISEWRAKDVAIRIALAASFASSILHLIGALPTFVHFWATTTTGKSMLLKMAASIWGNPEIGQYIKTFGSTNYAMEQYAGFYNSMPLILDELQLMRDRNGNLRFDVYKLTQGAAGGRGRKDGGLREELTWKLCCITSGEDPLTSISDGAGAYARIIDVQLKKRLLELEEGQAVSKVIDVNYGHAGRRFIDAVKGMDVKELQKKYTEYIEDLNKHKDIQPKQVMAAAALMLADEIADDELFHDEKWRLTNDEILPYLLTQEDVDTTGRAYEMLVSFVASNRARFDKNSQFEQMGIIEDDTAYFIRDQFNRFIVENKFSPRSIASYLADKGLIETYVENGKTRFDTKKTIGGVRVRVVGLKLEKIEDYIEPERRAPWDF